MDLTPEQRVKLAILKLRGWRQVWRRALLSMHVVCPTCGAPEGTLCAEHMFGANAHEDHAHHPERSKKAGLMADSLVEDPNVWDAWVWMPL